MPGATCETSAADCPFHRRIEKRFSNSPRTALAGMKEPQPPDGAAVYVLQKIVDLYCPTCNPDGDSHE